MQLKQFVANAIQSNPSRYAIDDGVLHLINDYFITQNWQPLTIEQHKAIAGLIRGRNHFLRDNVAYDKRSKKTAYEHVGQKSIYDFMDDDTKIQLPKITRYFSLDTSRYEQSNSRIKKSIRGVDNEHITVAKMLFPLLIANPQLKQKRQRKLPIEQALNDVLDSEEETIFDEVKQG